MISSKTVNDLTESIIHSLRRFIHVRRFASVNQVNGEESNCKWIQVFYLEIVRVCSLVYFNSVCKSGLSTTKTKFELDTSTRHKETQCGFFSLNSFTFCCAIYGTNVQIERTWKDSPRAHICCRTENFARPFTSNRLFERIQILNEWRFHRLIQL